MSIGNWVRRCRSSVHLGPCKAKWHLVESVVDGDAVTRCGRRMALETAAGLLAVSDVMPLTRMIDQPQLCKGGCE